MCCRGAQRASLDVRKISATSLLHVHKSSSVANEKQVISQQTLGGQTRISRGLSKAVGMGQHKATKGSLAGYVSVT